MNQSGAVNASQQPTFRIRASECAAIDIGDLKEAIHKQQARRKRTAGDGTAVARSGFTVPYGYVLESSARTGLRLKLHYTPPDPALTMPDELTLQMRATRPGFGGKRWWFICPDCQTRKGKLYIPPEGDHFACRDCHRLR